MKCKKCGATLLDTDTFCSECGEKVIIDKCPQCGEKLRDGVKFCSKCGYRLGSPIDYSKKVPEDEDIPVTGQMATDDIPFDLIEQNIIRDAARQLNDDEKKPVKNKKYKQEIYDSYEDYPEDNFDSYSSESDYEDQYDEEYGYEDESDDYNNDFEESEYENEPEKKSVLSRLFTAAIIVLGLIIVLGIAALFFTSRSNNSSDSDEKGTEEEEIQEEENKQEEVSDGTIGTITVISDVNIRDYPSTDNSTVITTAKTGETYSYYGYADGSEKWIHIKIDDSRDGYVYKEYVSINQ